MKKQDTIQLNVNIPKSLMKEIDNKAYNLGIPKTSLVIIALNQFINTEKNMNVLENITQIYNEEKNNMN